MIGRIKCWFGIHSLLATNPYDLWNPYRFYRCERCGLLCGGKS